ncbi:predicted protein [Sclerotinia sclerotiorum 1980 UF-70]|uniref:Uncharacterized protein n=1 Tax=Sclerotinia sclerotiorum (strain ATCC 18683 / 1980 / Ss-1) TaxID=665079 RepID=A7ELA2_SCLS1|nr:predicted protein [Sclerotinia sclerotiorum 1980 UF-70]EDO03618.1 predicted protein [Sclerotinia sclerotiorum 1980 UF-70]
MDIPIRIQGLGDDTKSEEEYPHRSIEYSDVSKCLHSLPKLRSTIFEVTPSTSVGRTVKHAPLTPFNMDRDHSTTRMPPTPTPQHAVMWNKIPRIYSLSTTEQLSAR